MVLLCHVTSTTYDVPEKTKFYQYPPIPHMYPPIPHTFFPLKKKKGKIEHALNHKENKIAWQILE